MQSNSFKVIGPKAALEELRCKLLEEPNAAQLAVSEPAIEPTPVRQADAVDILWMIIINIPTSVVGSFLHAWLRDRIKEMLSRGARLEVIAPSVSLTTAEPGAISPNDNPPT
jgi:hypothetical protein